MVKKVLPPINDQNQLPNLATSGEWKSEDSSFLEKLAKSLKVGGEDLITASDIVSVPDVWARVLIVRNGLLDGEKSIVREWRGTLALLGGLTLSGLPSSGLSIFFFGVQEPEEAGISKFNKGELD